MFRIGEFAGLAGMSAKMLRNYDRMGLFRPVWVDPTSGYRHYSATQLPEIRRVVALKDLGVPLREIGELISGGADLGSVLDARRRELEREQRELDRRLELLEITVAAGNGAGVPDVVLRPLAAVRVASLRRRLDPGSDLGPLFYRLESVVRDARARASRPPGTIIHESGADGSRDVEVFVPVTGPVDHEEITVRTIPRTRAATAIHRGPYDGLRGAVGALRSWVEATNLQVSGRMRVLYLQFNAEPELGVDEAYLADVPVDFVTEIQIPVR